MISALSASKALLRRRLLNPSSSLLLRHLCTGSQLSEVDEAKVTQAVEFLQNRNNWGDSDPLLYLIGFSSNLISHVVRRLPFHSEALKFLNFNPFHSLGIWLDIGPVPTVFMTDLAILKSRYAQGEKYWELYRVYKEENLPITVKDVMVLMHLLAYFDLVEKCVLLYDEIDPSLKDIVVCNVFIEKLLKAGRVDHALKVLDEMLQPESEVKPDQDTINSIYKLMSSINVDEIVELVLRFCQFSVYPEHSMVASLVQKLCKEGKIVEACGFLDELIKFHAPSLKDKHPRNRIISTLLNADRVDHARKVLDEMLQPEYEVKPNQETLNFLYKFKLSVDEIVEMVLRCCQFSVFPEDSMVASLVEKLCKEGKIVEACGFLDELMKFHTPTNANDCFDFVREKLKGRGKGTGKRRMKAYLTEMKEKEIYLSNKTVELILDKLLESEMVDEGIELFKWFKKGSYCVDIDTYNALVRILCVGRRFEELEDVLAEMKASGVKPNDTTYNNIVVFS